MSDKVIEFKNVHLYQGGEKILSDINLSIHSGELVYLIGKVGSGKSSFLKAIYAELSQFDGEIEAASYSIHSIRKREIPFLRRKIGIVFQDFQLLSDRSIYENLLFVLRATGWKKKKLMDARIMEMLSKVELSDKAHKMPHQLSGGEQQRVVIARALLNNPEIVLADEPTGNLDPETAESILSLLWEIRKAGKAVVVATHDYPIIEKFPSKIIQCEQGKVHEVAAFTPTDLEHFQNEKE